MGGSSDLCAQLERGEPIVLMGPTGSPTEIEPGETVILAGGGLGNAVLFSIGQAFRNAGSKVLYFAGYRHMIDRYKIADIEAAADVVVWCCDEAPGFVPRRPQDKSFVGNIVQGMLAYATGELGETTIAAGAADRIIAIGSDKMMAAVGAARHTVLKPYLKPSHRGIASINSPMQCMMKEICAQCLQPQHDPATGKLSYVFSCFNQDQSLDSVDFAGLDARLVAERGAGKAHRAMGRALPARRGRRRLIRRALTAKRASQPRDLLLPIGDDSRCIPGYLWLQRLSAQRQHRALWNDRRKARRSRRHPASTRARARQAHFAVRNAAEPAQFLLEFSTARPAPRHA